MQQVADSSLGPARVQERRVFTFSAVAQLNWLWQLTLSLVDRVAPPVGFISWARRDITPAFPISFTFTDTGAADRCSSECARVCLCAAPGPQSQVLSGNPFKIISDYVARGCWNKEHMEVKCSHVSTVLWPRYFSAVAGGGGHGWTTPFCAATSINHLAWVWLMGNMMQSLHGLHKSERKLRIKPTFRR